jgi:large subunit ribosomal protein L21
MYAVIRTGGKQYKVSAGDTVHVERLSGEIGTILTLNHVLLLTDGDQIEIGTPLVEGATVEATVTAHGRGPKVTIVKFRRRKHYRKQMGHRQDYTALRITGIKGALTAVDKGIEKGNED